MVIIKEKLNIIYKDEPYYSFPREYMYIRQEYIINKLLNQKINLKSYYNSDDQMLFLVIPMIKFSDQNRILIILMIKIIRILV